MSTQGTITLSGLPNPGDTVGANDGQASAILQIVDEFNKNIGTSKIDDGAVTAAKIAAEAFTAWTPTGNGITGVTATGFYIVIGKIAIISFNISGTSTDVTFAINNLPITCKKVEYGSAWAVNNSSALAAPCRTRSTASSATLNFDKDGTGNDGWTNSGTKQAYGTVILEVA